MVISSIDLKAGHVVQLKGGKDLVIERDDADKLIKEFNKYGEVAVIDLDAALGNTLPDGTSVNTPLLKSLLRQGNVRVGGGIRSVEKARELVSLGAEKIILGSRVWKEDFEEGSGDFLDTDFLNAVIEAVGKEKVIIAVDAINGKVAIKGWTKALDLDFITAAVKAEQYCSEIFYTCVEREGSMEGADIALASKLRAVVNCRVVIAGGVSSINEIGLLQKAGCDVQLGMSLYTGKLSLKDAFISSLNWGKVRDGLIPVIAQSEAGDVLMLGYANREAFEISFNTGHLTFFSRTRGSIWTKGETSGHYLDIIKVRADCDRDTVLATVHENGNVCHTGGYTCFTSRTDERSSLEKLHRIIKDRLQNPTASSYTASLTSKKVRDKITEEAAELVEASTHDEVLWEATDLLYFMSVLLCQEGIELQEIYNELDKRHKEKYK